MSCLSHCPIAFSKTAGYAKLDLGYLAHAIGLPREALVTADQVHFDPASGKLRLPGKPETQFTGDQQLAVVYELVLGLAASLAGREGRDPARQGQDRNAIDNLAVQGQKRLENVYRDPKRGWYRLNV